MRNAVLEEIFASNQVVDDSGHAYDLDYAVSPEEGELLTSLIQQNDVRRSLEIGCAYGISSLYICDALSEKPSPHHTIIDPHQSGHWQGIGLSNLRRSGFHFFECIEQFSEMALPKLLEAQRTFDFALIDGWHTFDHTLLDFFYCNRLLVDGGIIVIDDILMPPVQKAVCYILNYPNYEFLAIGGALAPLRSRRRVVESVVPLLGKALPVSVSERILQEPSRDPALSRRLHSGSMVALRKTGPDLRAWNWYKPF